MQAAFAQSNAEQAARKLARDTLSRRALLHNLKIVETGGSGHCLPYSIEHQLRQQGIVSHNMQKLRPDMADFIRDKADYFKQFLTAQQCEPPAWKRLIADIRHTVGDAKRWGGDLEISVLSCMFQCPIQYISSRLGAVFDEIITTEPNKSLGKWWTLYKRKNNLKVDFFLKPLTLIYEEGRHWQSSEPLIPQNGISAAERNAEGNAPASPGFSEGVHGDEAPAAEAPPRVEDGTPAEGEDALAAPGSAQGVRGAEAPNVGAPLRVLDVSGVGAPEPAHTTNGTHTMRMPRRATSASSIPESLVAKQRNAFISGSDADFNAWLAASNLQHGKAVLGAQLIKQFNAGFFHGVIVNPSIFNFFGAIWIEVESATMGQVFFENEKLSTAIRANKKGFTLTQQEDLNLPDITSSSVISVDGKFYSPTMAKSTHKKQPFCVIYEDGDVEWMQPVEANKAVRFHSQMGLLQEVNNNVDLLDILGLTVAATFGEVRSAFCSVRNEIHPDIFRHNAAATAFQKIGEAWDSWRASRSPSQGSSAPMHTTARSGPSRRQQPNDRSARADAQAPAGAQAQASQPSEDNIFGHYIQSLTPSDPAHGWTQALEFLSSKELAGELFELRDFNLSTLTFLDQKLRTAFRDCFHKVLLLASKFADSIRARDTLNHLARMLPTLILSHGKKVALTRAKAFLKGDWKTLWNQCRSQGVARQDKLSQAPQTATQRSTKQVDVLAQKYARAGNLSKASQTICSTLKPALKPDTLDKLKAKNPQASTDFDSRHWPTAEEMDALRRDEDWLNTEADSFSVKKIRQYYARCAPLSAQDVDGWRPREHIAWMFNDGDETFHDLIRTQLILPYVKGDFYEGHLEEVAGGKFIALEKLNNSVRPIVIGSTWRRAPASLSVAEVNSDVANFLMSTYDNFLQFAGQKDGATRCAQVTQLLAADWDVHAEENPLVVMQLDIINAFCSVSRQAQFDVLAEKASTSYDNGNVRDGDLLPCAPSLRKYWGYFQSMHANSSTLRFIDHRGQPHHLPCSKGGQQGDGFETVRFAVTTLPSIGRVFQRHPACKGAAICDDIFVVAPLQEALALVAELKLILKQDLDLDLDVPKFNCFFPGNRLNDDQARELFKNTLAHRQSFLDLATMDAGVSTQGLRVAGVPIGVEAWVTKFVEEKIQDVIVDVGKIDHVLTDGILHYQMLRFCQNTRPGFLTRNTPTPLISESLGRLDSVILESMCTKGTGGTHTDWTSEQRSFANMKLQLPHHRGGYGITPVAGSGISAFYASSASLVRWLGLHSNAQQDLVNLAAVWAPGQNLSNPDVWTAPLLQALKCSHALLLAEYECVEWGPAAGPAPSAAPVAIAGPVDTQNPTAGGTRHGKPPSALSPLVLPPLSMLFESSQGEGRRNSSAEEQQPDGERPPADPSQRTITAHLMQCWKDHQDVLGHIALARSEEYLKLQSVQRIPAIPKTESDTIFNEYFPQTDPVDPNAQPANPAAPAEKKKIWNLNWSPLSWMADMSAQRPVTRFSMDLWMSFFCRSMGAPIPMLQAHAMARTRCSCKIFSLDPQGDHVLTCKKHTGATRGHNHVMDVLAQLARNTGCSVRVNHKVSTTAAVGNKQGDVELLNFGLDGYTNLVIDVSICCDHIGSSTVQNGNLNGRMQTNDYLEERARVKIRKYRHDYAVVGTAFAPAIVSVAGQIHPEFLRLLWVLADKQTRNYYALIGAEEEIGGMAFTWSRARTFSYNKNSIGKAIAYATATRLHLSVHSTAPPARRQAGQPMSSDECLLHGAAHASHRAPPRPAPPRPAVNVGEGAHNVAPSTHATCADASRDADVVAGGTNAAGGVAAAEWLAATLGDSVINTAAPGDSGDGGDGDDCAGDDRIATHSSLHDDAMSDDNDDDKVDTLDVILGHVSQREDAGYDDAGEDVSVGVGVSAVVGVGVNGQGVSLGVGLGNSLVVASPPLTSLDS